MNEPTVPPVMQPVNGGQRLADPVLWMGRHIENLQICNEGLQIELRKAENMRETRGWLCLILLAVLGFVIFAWAYNAREARQTIAALRQPTKLLTDAEVGFVPAKPHLFTDAEFLGTASPAADAITIEQAAQHIGETRGVHGRLAAVRKTRTGAIFMDFGAPWPGETFTAVSFGSAVPFEQVAALTNRDVTVHGRIAGYKGRPEIVVRSANQISAN